ncbi:FecR family protein [uncultured Alistipes sp.]|uniref:FecR family protein n=1 Tax=uncultured Alistipes sp. TaxID=538949 RepID=UPI00258E9D9B|nr:FecR family protein [uncultured Alistipes sp.]
MNNSELLEHWIGLFIKHLSGTLDESEAAEFDELTRDPHFEALREQLQDSGYLARRMAEYDRYNGREAFGRFRTAAGIQKPAGSLRRWGIAATGVAAAVALAAGVLLATRTSVPDQRTRTLQLADAIYPAPDKVTLTLADGRKMVLDEQVEQQIEGVGRISYGAEGVKYEAAPEVAEEAPQYNELSVPEGSKCLVTLEDGTRVWLNARSTLRYPVKFTGGERHVELNGEGLFDVTHNPERPFVVKAGKTTMTVRGTKFNVRDFAGESLASTTLLEGCVEVGNQSGTVTLEPGMQSQTRGAADPLTVREVDAGTYAAWTQDKLAFYSADLEEVLTDIRSWYRVETQVNVNPAEYTLTGKIPRDYSLAKVIELLETITDLELVMPDENTLIVNKRP